MHLKRFSKNLGILNRNHPAGRCDGLVKRNKFMKKQKQIQQGDVLLRRITKINETAVKLKADKRGYVLAEGEVTGHYHGIEECDDVELYKLGEQLILANTKPVIIKHQEHGNVMVEPGIWEVEGLREKDWLSGLERKVLD